MVDEATENAKETPKRDRRSEPLQNEKTNEKVVDNSPELVECFFRDSLFLIRP